MIFLIIYLIGCIATVVLLYCTLDKGDKVNVGELIMAILVSAFSWFSFLLFLAIMYCDKVVFTKK